MHTTSSDELISRRPFGRHPDQVSIIGLGGYHLGKVRTSAEAVRIVHEAIGAGINFLDNAWEYHDGESEERMGRAIKDRRDSVFLMTKVCTHGRDARVAMRQLDQSLRRLRTDHLDLWQIHECVYHNDPVRHFAQGGVAEALEKAKAQGKVRYVGCRSTSPSMPASCRSTASMPGSEAFRRACCPNWHGGISPPSA